MIDAVWLQILHRIPADYYDCLSIVTVTGAELVVQQVFKLERDFMVVRARTSGTGDLGRTILIPFAQIDFVAFNRKMTEDEVMKIFAEPMPELALPQQVAYQQFAFAPPTTGVAPLAPTPPPTRPAPTPAAESSPPTDGPATTVAAEPAAAPRPGQISKTILLARLRERLAEKAK